MRPSFPRLAFLAVLALLVSVTSGVRAQTPTVLPLLRACTDGQAFSINDWGEIAGIQFFDLPEPPPTECDKIAVLWDRNGTPRALPPLDGDISSEIGSSFSRGNSINNHGAVVGSSIGSDRSRTAAQWGRNGLIKRVLPPLPSDTESFATAISAHGRVAGNSVGSDGSETAVVWDHNNDTPMALPPLPGDTESHAHGINPRGQVSGDSIGSDGSRTAVLWDRKGPPTALSPLPGDNESRAKGINARGQVVGFSFVRNGPSTPAVVWDHKGTPTALPPPTGHTGSSPNSINARGEVVGTSQSLVEGSTAVVWDRDGSPTALPNPPLTDFDIFHTEALGINARGDIVGTTFLEFGQRSLALVWR